MDDIIKFAGSLEKSGLLTDGATKSVKHEIKKQDGVLLGAMMELMAASLIAPMASSLLQPAASSLINAIYGKGQEGGFLPLLELPLRIKALGKGLKGIGR